jgi:two-component system cell cycle response regulator CtrA
MRILVIEDDSATAHSIELMLQSASFNVFTTDLGEEGVDLGKLYDYDIILLDLSLPDMSGLEVLRTLRVCKVRTPILILSGLAALEDKVSGFGFGADDYMTKPFHKDELVARILAIVRRSKGHAQSIIQTGDLVVNLDTKTVEVNAQRVYLNRQRVPDAGAAEPAQGHDTDQGDVPQPSLRWSGRAGTQDHRRLHLQAPQETGQCVRR